MIEPAATVDRASSAGPVLEVKDLVTHLYTRWGITKAVDGVSLELYPGEMLGIVGESGSGKSMLALSLGATGAGAGRPDSGWPGPAGRPRPPLAE